MQAISSYPFTTTLFKNVENIVSDMQNVTDLCHLLFWAPGSKRTQVPAMPAHVSPASIHVDLLAVTTASTLLKFSTEDKYP